MCDDQTIALRWNEDAASIRVSSISTASWPLKPELFSSLNLSIQIDGVWRTPQRWQINSDGQGIAQLGEMDVRFLIHPITDIQPHPVLQARVTNRGSHAVRFGGFRFSYAHTRDDFLSLPGERFAIYREGWTAVAAAGTVRFGEHDFDLDQAYRPFAVSSTADYQSDLPNRFSAEYVAVLHDRQTKASLLIGFISSANQVTRIAIDLVDGGATRLEAYSYGDNIVVDPGEMVESEELVILNGTDGYGLLEKFAAAWGRRMKALTWSHTPAGWCSWYYYFEKVTESNVLENVQSLAARQPPLPLEYIQIDDGYQSALGDWLECKSTFPHGLSYVSEQIRRSGYKPGLWLAPFMVEEQSKLYAAHPEWMIQDQNGQTLWVTKWRGSRVAVLDCTLAESQQWLRELFATLAQMGFEYVKLDFLMYECAVLGGIYRDPKATRAQACRRGLQAIRDGFGNRFILGGTTVLGPAVGLVNGERIGTDITPYWQPEQPHITREATCVPNVCRNIINRRYMHGRLWLNDPDVHIARLDYNKLTLEEIILWTSALWLTGGMTLLGDNLCTLPPEREKLCRMLLDSVDHFDTRPLDFFEHEYPSVWMGCPKICSLENRQLTIGLFNFEEQSKLFDIDLISAGIAAKTSFSLYDFWAQNGLDGVHQRIIANVPPHQCKLLIVTPAASGAPQLTK